MQFGWSSRPPCKELFIPSLLVSASQGSFVSSLPVSLEVHKNVTVNEEGDRHSHKSAQVMLDDIGFGDLLAVTEGEHLVEPVIESSLWNQVSALLLDRSLLFTVK